MVELRKITKENYEGVLALRVSEAQRGFVPTVTEALAQAWVYYDTAYPFAVYAEGAPVGFIMLGYYEEKTQQRKCVRRHRSWPFWPCAG